LHSNLSTKPLHSEIHDYYLIRYLDHEGKSVSMQPTHLYPKKMSLTRIEKSPFSRLRKGKARLTMLHEVTEKKQKFQDK
jgi:hypothetical protein